MNEWMRQEIEDAVADATTTPVVAEWERVALVAEIVRIVGDTMPPAREGFEWVELPSEMVSDFAADGVPGSRRAAQLIIACREAVARRPKPEPRTERVPWWEAVGRLTRAGVLLGRIVQAYPSEGNPGGMYVEYDLPEHGTTGKPSRNADGTVEVLVEDGDQ